MGTSYDGWTPPPDSELTIKNCSVAAYWIATYVKQSYYDTGLHDASVEATYDYLSDLIPVDYDDQPNFSQVLDWYYRLDTNTTTWGLFFDPITNCTEEVCKLIDWEGDPDLAGIGVMVTYYLAAAFVTLYFVVLGLNKFGTFTGRARIPWWEKHVGAFRESVNTFIDAGLLFAISMLVAGVYRFSSSLMHPDKTHSIYGLINSTYMSAFAVFPPLILQTVAGRLRRQRIRLVLWFLVIALSLTIAGMFLNLVENFQRLKLLLDRDSAIIETIWVGDCAPDALADGVVDTMYAAQILLGLNIAWWLYCALPRSVHQWLRSVTERRQSVRKMWLRFCSFVKGANAVLCCLMMWVLLGLFTGYRSAVEARMGRYNLDTQWSFGQVLAMATWVPVVVDLVTLYLYGEKDGLQGKVSQRYNVVPAVERNDVESAETVYLKVGNTSYAPAYAPAYTPV